jgi:hypothetical protein
MSAIGEGSALQLQVLALEDGGVLDCLLDTFWTFKGDRCKTLHAWDEHFANCALLREEFPGMLRTEAGWGESSSGGFSVFFFFVCLKQFRN